MPAFSDFSQTKLSQSKVPRFVVSSVLVYRVSLRYARGSIMASFVWPSIPNLIPSPNQPAEFFLEDAVIDMSSSHGLSLGFVTRTALEVESHVPSFKDEFRNIKRHADISKRDFRRFLRTGRVGHQSPQRNFAILTMSSRVLGLFWLRGIIARHNSFPRPSSP